MEFAKILKLIGKIKDKWNFEDKDLVFVCGRVLGEPDNAIELRLNNGYYIVMYSDRIYLQQPNFPMESTRYNTDLDYLLQTIDNYFSKESNV